MTSQKDLCARLLIFVVFCAITLFSFTATSQEHLQPPLVTAIDQHGVNLATGKLKLPGLEVSIGTSDSGLRRVVNENNDNHSNSLIYSYIPLTGNGNSGAGILILNASVHGKVYRFYVGGGNSKSTANLIAPPNSGTYSQINGAGYLSCSGDYTQRYQGGSCDVVLNDGTEVHFDQSSSYGGYPYWVASNITKPDGEIVSYNYHFFNGSRVQPKTVASSLGWMLKYEVDGNNELTKVTAINTSNTYCSMSASSCSVSSTYPYATAIRSGSTTTIKRNGTTIVSYTVSGNTTTLSYPSGVSKTYTMSGSDVTEVTVGNNSWQYSYAPTGSARIATVTNPDGTSRKVGSGPYGITFIESETGHRKTYHYQTVASYFTKKLKKITEDGSPSVEYDYDDRGNVTSISTYPNGGGTPLVTTAHYPETCNNIKTCNKPEWITSPLGHTTDYEYFSHGGMKKITTYPDSSTVVEKRFDFLEFTPKIKNSSGGMISQPQVWRRTKVDSCMTDNYYNCLNTPDERSDYFHYTQNNIMYNGSTSQGGDGLTIATNLTINGLGQTEKINGPRPGDVDSEYRFYDALGRLKGTIGVDPDGSGPRPRLAERIHYNNDGKVSRINQGTASGVSESSLNNMSINSYIRYDYDSSLGVLKAEKEYYQGSQLGLTQYSYDENLRVECKARRLNPNVFSSVVNTDACQLGSDGSDGPDRITKYEYTDDGVVKEETVAFGTNDQSVAFDKRFNADGTLDYVLDGEGNKTKYYYDDFNRNIKTCFASPSNGSYTNSSDCTENDYSTDGTLDNITLRDGQVVSYEYDDIGRLTGKSGAVSESISYNNFDQIVSRTNNGVTETFGYSSLGWLEWNNQPSGYIDYVYDDYGRRERMIYPDEFYVDYSYSNADEVTGISTSHGGVSFVFQYDNLGRRSRLDRSNGRDTSYDYDSASRLDEVLHHGVNKITLGYNNAFQISSKTNSSSAYNYSYSNEPLTSYGIDGLNRIESINSSSLSYDARGNMANDGEGRSYSYNAKNLMTSSTISGTTTSLLYDASDRLRRVNGTRFLYDGDDLIAEYNSSGTLIRRYVHGPGVDEPLLWFEGSGYSNKRYLHADHQGSIIAVTGSTGNLLNRNAYDSYGNKQSSNSSYTSRFAYTGQIYLKEIGLYYYKARMYNSKLGRFMQTDPIGYADGINWYAYVGNDPINYSDPTGLAATYPTGFDTVDIPAPGERIPRCYGCNSFTGADAESFINTYRFFYGGSQGTNGDGAQWKLQTFVFTGNTVSVDAGSEIKITLESFALGVDGGTVTVDAHPLDSNGEILPTFRSQKPSTLSGWPGAVQGGKEFIVNTGFESSGGFRWFVGIPKGEAAHGNSSGHLVKIFVRADQ